ncbi:GxxExxY protein [Ancylomarina sp. YFZ004]
MDIDELIKKVIGAAFKVHNTLGAGFLESIYEKAMMIELTKIGLAAQRQNRMSVIYNGETIGDFFADILVESILILELKTVDQFSKSHDRQLINYLVATGIDNGLLINFGESVEVRRKYRRYTPSK